MNCGCTMQHPTCAVGEELFAFLAQSQQKLNMASREQREKQWEAFSQARIAYIDHIQGWRQGDVRIRQEGGAWRLERRQWEQWAFQFGVTGENTLRTWLKKQGFWRYAQIENGEPRGRLTGYYHQRNARADQISTNVENSITGLLWQDAQGNSSYRAQKTGLPSGGLLSAELDQKTELALLIAVLVCRSAQPLTIVDRLSIQRKAVGWLLSNGMQTIEADAMQTIAVLIDKASSMREMLEHARKTTNR